MHQPRARQRGSDIQCHPKEMKTTLCYRDHVKKSQETRRKEEKLLPSLTHTQSLLLSLFSSEPKLLNNYLFRSKQTFNIQRILKKCSITNLRCGGSSLVIFILKKKTYLSMNHWLACNSCPISSTSCLSLSNARITGMGHYACLCGSLYI